MIRLPPKVTNKKSTDIGASVLQLLKDPYILLCAGDDTNRTDGIDGTVYGWDRWDISDLRDIPERGTKWNHHHDFTEVEVVVESFSRRERISQNYPDALH